MTRPDAFTRTALRRLCMLACTQWPEERPTGAAWSRHAFAPLLRASRQSSSPASRVLDQPAAPVFALSEVA